MASRSNRIRALLIILGTATAVAGSQKIHAHDDEPMTFTDPKTAKFEPIPSMPGCASAAIVRGNPRSGPAWVFLKLGSGCRVPWHWHTANEYLVVISGQGTLATKDGPSIPIAPGAFAALPSHHVHQANCTRSCLFFSIADGAFDIHYVDAQGAEISADDALKPASRTAKPKIQTKSKSKTKPK